MSRKTKTKSRTSNNVHIGSLGRQGSITINQGNTNVSKLEQHIKYTEKPGSEYHISNREVSVRGGLGLFSALASVISLIVSGFTDWMTFLDFLGPNKSIKPIVFFAATAALLLACASQWEYVRMLIARIAHHEELYISRGKLGIPQKGDDIKIIELVAPCGFLECDGEVQLRKAPPRERGNDDVVGVCSKGGRRHTYTIDQNGIGYAREFDWRPLRDGEM